LSGSDEIQMRRNRITKAFPQWMVMGIGVIHFLPHRKRKAGTGDVTIQKKKEIDKSSGCEAGII